jgi:hypothetical protein
MVKYLRISSYIRRPFLIYDICNRCHLKFPYLWGKFRFFFISVAWHDGHTRRQTALKSMHIKEKCAASVREYAHFHVTLWQGGVHLSFRCPAYMSNITRGGGGKGEGVQSSVWMIMSTSLFSSLHLFTNLFFNFLPIWPQFCSMLWYKFTLLQE